MNADEVESVLSEAANRKRSMPIREDKDLEQEVKAKKAKGSRGRKCCLCGKIDYSRMDQHLKAVHKENRAADRQRYAKLLVDVSTLKFFLNMKSCEIRVCHPYVLFTLLSSLRSRRGYQGTEGFEISVCLHMHRCIFFTFACTDFKFCR